MLIFYMDMVKLNPHESKEENVVTDNTQLADPEMMNGNNQVDASILALKRSKWKKYASAFGQFHP